MSNRKILTGLKVGDYIHPEDAAYFQGSAENSGLVDKGLSMLSQSSVAFLRKGTDGRYVGVDGNTAPYLTGILKDTCRILDAPFLPEVFVRHERSAFVTAGGDSENDAQILLPDYILNEFDEDMLYFVLGRSVAMFRAGHARLAAVYAFMSEGISDNPFEATMKARMKAAGLSSDRGGLLACQSFAAAAKCIMAEAGMPLQEMRGKSDDEIAAIVNGFMLGTENLCPGWLTGAFDWSDTPKVRRLRELKAWYENGYAGTVNRTGRRELR